MMYICEICDAWRDNDYSPAEFLKFNQDEKPVCDDCFVDQQEADLFLFQMTPKTSSEHKLFLRLKWGRYDKYISSLETSP